MLSIHSQHPQEIFIYEYPFERLYSGTYRRISDTGESFRRLYFVKRVIFVVLMTFGISVAENVRFFKKKEGKRRNEGVVTVCH
ncbi:uncharacterized protein LOC118764210 isoform X2 [Octopus sinensis]|uniref:Uncharacterized protein LOC118764210 isoform X2 n=1 Tax=Octopus sinensis TaxID=2607531 RepID=A0A7E6EZZ0_9MOLL|nr:uncharacterized protein LOC118764210 isoform X2 [Octopus sinensis]